MGKKPEIHGEDGPENQPTINVEDGLLANALFGTNIDPEKLSPVDKYQATEVAESLNNLIEAIDEVTEQLDELSDE